MQDPRKGVHCCKSQFQSVLSANDFVPEDRMAFVEDSAIRSPSFCCKSQVKLWKVTAHPWAWWDIHWSASWGTNFFCAWTSSLATCNKTWETETAGWLDDWMIGWLDDWMIGWLDDYHVTRRSERGSTKRVIWGKSPVRSCSTLNLQAIAAPRKSINFQH